MFKREWRLWDAEGGASAAVVEPPAPAANEPPPWAKAIIESSTRTNDALARLADSIAQPRAVQAPTQEPPEKDYSAAELEALPRADFAEYIANKTARHLDKQVIAPLRSQLQSVTSRTTEAQVIDAIEKCRGKFEDFDHYKAPILELAKQHPTLTPEKLYILAVTDAGKQPKLRPSATTKTGGDDTGDKPVPKIKFGGLRPQNSGASGKTTTPPKDTDEALSRAWSETVASFGEPVFEE